jgi:hypothetical protein
MVVVEMVVVEMVGRVVPVAAVGGITDIVARTG